MTFKENALGKISALSKAVLGLVIFVCLEYAVFSAFDFFHIDRSIYRGVYNFSVSAVTIAMMVIIHKISSAPGDPLIKVKKIGPDQAICLVIIALGMLGFVTLYISVADMISDYLASMKEALEEYRESVDRYSDTPQQVIPLWDSILYIVVVCFIVPVAEEMIFRGVVFGYLRKGFGPVASVLLCAVGFGIMHGISIHIGYALACGIIIATCYYLTDSLIAPILLHMIFNVFGSGVAYVFGLDEVKIPAEAAHKILQGINVTTLLFMPVAVFAFAFLLHIKRRNDGKKIVEEYKATHTPASGEEDPFADEGENDNKSDSVDSEELA